MGGDSALLFFCVLKILETLAICHTAQKHQLCQEHGWPRAAGLCMFDIWNQEDSSEMCISRQDFFLLTQAIKVMLFTQQPSSVMPLQGEELYSA